MYWKCLRNERTESVFLLAFRSEQSTRGKPRLHYAVNGCTTELLPPILRSKVKERGDGDHFICIQTDDEKIVFLQAVGR